MNSELETRSAMVGAFALMALFGGIFLAIYPGYAALGAWLDRIDAPAWVQAVGSVAAIIAAIFIAHGERRQHRQSAAEKKIANHKVAFALISAIGEFCEAQTVFFATLPISGGRGKETIQQAIADLRAPLMNLNPWEMGDAELVATISQISLKTNLLSLQVEHGPHVVLLMAAQLKEDCDKALLSLEF